MQFAVVIILLVLPSSLLYTLQIVVSIGGCLSHAYAMKAFKKRLKLTALDEDSRLGRGAFSAGAQGICAIQPPNQYPPEVWAELCRQGKLCHSGHGLYELPRTK